MSTTDIDPVGGSTYYGVKVYSIGDDGDYFIAFGHVRPLQFLAACNKYSRLEWGLDNLWDDAGVNAEDVQQILASITHTYGEFEQTSDDRWDWVVDWSKYAKRETPITVLNVG